MPDKPASENGDSNSSPLDRAAAQGPLPGLAEQDAQEERGDDDSDASDEPKGSLFGDMFGPDGADTK